MLRIIAIANQKGGSGKTTTAVNLASCLAELGRRVLLVDLDPQGNASKWLGVDAGGSELLSVFLGERPLASTVRETSVERLSIIPTNRTFAKAELMLVTDPEATTVFQRALEEVDLDQWDYLVIDCPPQLGLITMNALMAAREVIVPAEANELSTSGISELGLTIERIRKKGNPQLSILGILVVRHDKRMRLTRNYTEALNESFGSYVFKTFIRQSARVAEAPSFNQPVNVYEPKCPATDDFRSLARQIDAPAKVATHA